MTVYTLTATATDSTTGQTGQRTQTFTTGAAAGIVPVSAGPIAQTLSPAFGRATAAGSLLVARVAVNSSASTNPLTTGAGGWLLAGGGGGPFEWSALFYKPNCAANETAPVFSPGGNGVNFSQLAEYTGAAATAVLDRVAAATGDQVLTAQAPGPDTQAGDLAVSVAFWNGSTAGGAVSVTSFTDSAGSPVTGTLAQSVQGTAYFATLGGIAGNTGSGADKSVMALSVFSGGSGVIATFKAASGGGGAALAVTPGTVPAIWQAFPYAGKPLAATGGTPPYTWAVASGALPAGTSLSSAGVISGTCTTAGTYSFTVRVTDSAAHTATAAMTSVVNPPPNGAALATTSVSGGNLGPYAGNVSGTGFPGNTGFNDYVSQNDQGVFGNGGSQTIKAYDLSHFYSTVNAVNVGGAVQTGPNNSINFTSYGAGGLGTGGAVTPLSAFNTLTSTYQVVDPDVGTFECAWDIWTNYPVDIMVWVDISPDRGNGGATMLTPNLSIGGQMWDLYRWAGPGSELMFMLQGPGGTGTFARQQSGTVDIKAFLTYCVTAGLVPAPLTISLIMFGWEICQTNGPENFICVENHMNWT